MGKFLSTLFCISIPLLPLPVMAGEAHTIRSMTSIGKGKALVEPDLAVLNLYVQNNNKLATDAFAENSKIIKNVVSAIKAYGIEDRDIQTTGINVYPQYEDDSDSARHDASGVNPIIGYRVMNGLFVRIRNLKQIGEIIQKSFETGANELGGLNLTNENFSRTCTLARQKAVADAMEKVKNLAESAKVKLGRIIHVSAEDDNLENASVDLNGRVYRSPSASGGGIFLGENSCEAQVKVTYEIH